MVCQNSRVTRAFPKRQKISDNNFLITEVCFYPDGGKSIQKLNTFKTGWKVLNPKIETTGKAGSSKEFIEKTVKAFRTRMTTYEFWKTCAWYDKIEFLITLFFGLGVCNKENFPLKQFDQITTFADVNCNTKS